MYDLLINANFFVRENKEITDIIMSEAQPYFDNQKSVDEVVDIINSRVRLIVSQQK